jgi:vancomycin resistance protein YoaR
MRGAFPAFARSEARSSERQPVPHGNSARASASVRWLASAILIGALVVCPAAARGASRVAQLDDVGAFTTPFPCCQPRIINIRRAAQLLNAYVVPPQGRFSMNAALGPRTRARGFVPAPMISGGRLVDSVGGGISQVATTLYNAAFFAGLDFVEHTPHSFYISRYPMGREATISWGGPELIFDNSWAAPLRMRFLVRRTSLTVRFYSRMLGRRVESWTGRPNAFRPPSIRVVHNPGLPPGTRRVVQAAGPAGFTIEYGRRVYRFSRLLRRETWRVHYQPEDEIIEVGTR